MAGPEILLLRVQTMPCSLLHLSGKAEWPLLLNRLEGRGDADHSRDAAVAAMLEAVRKEGDKAVLEYCRQFDCPEMTLPLRVSQEELEAASRSVDPADLAVIAEAAKHIREFTRLRRNARGS